MAFASTPSSTYLSVGGNLVYRSVLFRDGNRQLSTSYESLISVSTRLCFYSGITKMIALKSLGDGFVSLTYIVSFVFIPKY